MHSILINVIRYSNYLSLSVKYTSRQNSLPTASFITLFPLAAVSHLQHLDGRRAKAAAAERRHSCHEGRGSGRQDARRRLLPPRRPDATRGAFLITATATVHVHVVLRRVVVRLV